MDRARPGQLLPELAGGLGPPPAQEGSGISLEPLPLRNCCQPVAENWFSNLLRHLFLLCRRSAGISDSLFFRMHSCQAGMGIRLPDYLQSCRGSASCLAADEILLATMHLRHPTPRTPPRFGQNLVTHPRCGHLDHLASPKRLYF